MRIVGYTNRKGELYFGSKSKIYIIIDIFKVFILLKFWKFLKCKTIIKRYFVCNNAFYIYYIFLSNCEELPSHRWSNTGPIGVFNEFVRSQSFLNHDSKQPTFAFILQFMLSLNLFKIKLWNSEIMRVFIMSTSQINVLTLNVL